MFSRINHRGLCVYSTAKSLTILYEQKLEIVTLTNNLQTSSRATAPHVSQHR